LALLCKDSTAHDHVQDGAHQRKDDESTVDAQLRASLATTTCALGIMLCERLVQQDKHHQLEDHISDEA